MYNVNVSVPKTLCIEMVKQSIITGYCYAEDRITDDKIRDILRDICHTPISPELKPTDKRGELEQKTESSIGPYILHDFFLYYMIRYGFSPNKVFLMAKNTFGTKYSEKEILKWLTVFIKRFFSQQFKRSCLPDGPKIGSVSLSPRGDWRMPSDASRESWLEALTYIPNYKELIN